MRAGDLRIRARLQERSEGARDSGGLSVRYVDVDTLYIGVSTTGGDEFFRMKKLNPELTHEVKMRFREDIAADMRLVYKGHVLQIDAISTPKGKRDELLVFCHEIVQ